MALNFLCAVPIAVLIFCVSRYPTRVSRFLCMSPLVLLGEISYSIYSVHTWTLRIFIRAPVDVTTAGVVDAVFRIALGIGVTLVLATATYRLIEIPGRTSLRRFFDQSKRFGSRADNFRGQAPGVASRWLARWVPLRPLSGGLLGPCSSDPMVSPRRITRLAQAAARGSPAMVNTKGLQREGRHRLLRRISAPRLDGLRFVAASCVLIAHGFFYLVLEQDNRLISPYNAPLIALSTIGMTAVHCCW